MSILNSLFNSEKTYKATIQAMSQSLTNGTLGPKVYTTSKTVDCLFWRGGISKSFLSDKFKADITAAFLFKPEDILMQEIPSTGRILLNYNPAVIITKLVNHAGTYAIGTTTMLIDGFDDSKLPIKKFDTFTIASETGTSEHTVSNVILTSGISTSITFTPALVSTVADDAPIVVIPNLGAYSIIYADNIANQEEVMMCPVKEFIP